MKRSLLLMLLAALAFATSASAEERPLPEAREAKGRISALSASSITVQG